MTELRDQLPNPPLQRADDSVAALPLAFAAERQYRWADRVLEGGVGAHNDQGSGDDGAAGLIDHVNAAGTVLVKIAVGQTHRLQTAAPGNTE